ncbi:MAG: hypothetical protein NVSMB31_07420 [Vulcanimicrobiaceae bacterium]
MSDMRDQDDFAEDTGKRKTQGTTLEQNRVTRGETEASPADDTDDDADGDAGDDSEEDSDDAG